MDTIDPGWLRYVRSFGDACTVSAGCSTCTSFDAHTTARPLACGCATNHAVKTGSWRGLRDPRRQETASMRSMACRPLPVGQRLSVPQSRRGGRQERGRSDPAGTTYPAEVDGVTGWTVVYGTHGGTSSRSCSVCCRCHRRHDRRHDPDLAPDSITARATSCPSPLVPRREMEIPRWSIMTRSAGSLAPWATYRAALANNAI